MQHSLTRNVLQIGAPILLRARHDLAAVVYWVATEQRREGLEEETAQRMVRPVWRALQGLVSCGAIGCVALHEDEVPDTSLGARGSTDRLQILVDQEHRAIAQVVPVVIEARRSNITTNPHCIAIVGFPGVLDVPLGADCPAGDAGSQPGADANARLCVTLRAPASEGPFEGTRIAAYHPAKANEAFTAFAHMHDNAWCSGAPVAEVAVVVRLGSEPSAAGDPEDAGPPSHGGFDIVDAGTDDAAPPDMPDAAADIEDGGSDAGE